ncbi:hypothetical protein AB0I55_31025 [Actinocatenispora sera]|uniref:hypothetical protein n=1 Tax=Actinocatenispora sera TaxID=390989 RepID=UPI0033CB84A7
MTRRARWLWATVALWAVVLVALAFAAASRPTVKQQQSPAAARPSVQAALASVLAAAGPDTVTAVGPYRQVGTCSLTAARRGVEWSQVVDVYGPTARLAGLADRLPARYQAKSELSFTGGGRMTVAHPSPFLKLTVRAAEKDPGHVIATVDTGCRPTTGNPYPAFLAAASDRERGTAKRVFGLFDATPRTWQRAELGCGARTVTATATAPSSLAPLGRVLDAHPPAGRLITHNDSRYVYLDHGRGLVVAADGDRLAVTATTPCR